MLQNFYVWGRGCWIRDEGIKSNSALANRGQSKKQAEKLRASSPNNVPAVNQRNVVKSSLRTILYIRMRLSNAKWSENSIKALGRQAENDQSAEGPNDDDDAKYRISHRRPNV